MVLYRRDSLSRLPCNPFRHGLEDGKELRGALRSTTPCSRLPPASALLRSAPASGSSSDPAFGVNKSNHDKNRDVECGRNREGGLGLCRVSPARGHYPPAGVQRPCRLSAR